MATAKEKARENLESERLLVEALPDDVAKFLNGAHVPEDTSDAQDEIVARILHAEGIEDIFGTQTVLHTRDLVGHPLTLTGVKWYKSRFEGTPEKPAKTTFFAVIEGVNVNKEKILFTTSALTIMAQVFRAQALAVLPDIRVKIVQKETPTAGGFQPYWLEVAD